MPLYLVHSIGRAEMKCKGAEKNYFQVEIFTLRGFISCIILCRLARGGSHMKWSLHK